LPAESSTKPARFACPAHGRCLPRCRLNPAACTACLCACLPPCCPYAPPVMACRLPYSRRFACPACRLPTVYPLPP